MSELIQQDIRGLQSLLQKGEVKPSELFAAFRAQAQAQESLNAFAAINEFDESEFDESAADNNGGDNNPLANIPIAHKSIFCSRRHVSHCGSNILKEFKSPFDSAVVERCTAAGMPVLGMTHMDEFAMGSSGEHSAFGATANPWNTAYVPGGSSSGSAAAVAARCVPIATATDTGGSIRQPAAFCGVSGIKPTYGRVSRWGMVAFASSFDQGGVIAKSAEDCALGLNAIAGFDERDSTSLQVADEDFTAALADSSDSPDSLKGVRVGIPQEFFQEGLDSEVGARVQEAIQQLQKMGAVLVEVSLPSFRFAIPAYYVLTCAEASSNLSRFDGVRYGARAEDAESLGDMFEQTRSQGFGQEVKRRIFIGAYVLSYGYYDAYYRRAMKVRQIISNDFARVFEQCDVLAGPTTPNPAFKLNAVDDEHDPVAMYQQDIYTVPVNLAGLPAMSIPCGLVRELPVGLQLIAPRMCEARLLSVAHQYQTTTDFHRQSPPSIKA